MKLQARAIESFLRQPDPAIRAILVYGPDHGLVRERADSLGRTVLADLGDPFRVADLPAGRLVEDPVRLADEAAAQSLTGGRRLIRIRDADDRSQDSFARFLQTPPAGDSLVVVEAGDLGPRAPLRLLFEGSPIAAALPCYVDDETSLRRVLETRLRDAGLTAERDALAVLAECLVGDRLVAAREIEKLILYMGSSRTIRLVDVQAVVGDAAAIDLDEAAWSAAAGNPGGTDKTLRRLFGEGQSAVAILRLAQKHFQRLHWVSTQLARGVSLESAMAGLKPPVFYKRQAAFTAQVRRWTPAKLAEALDRLAETEAACKRTGAPDETLCARTLLGLATAAAAWSNR